MTSLAPPTVRPYPREFYEAIAAAYLSFVEQGSHRPAAEISKISGAPVKTVHGWVSAARRLGVLGPGQPGRSGANFPRWPTPRGYADSGLAYCRVHHGVVECDEGDMCCDMADGVEVRSHRRPSAEDEGCDLAPLLYRAGDDAS